VYTSSATEKRSLLVSPEAAAPRDVITAATRHSQHAFLAILLDIL